jgi:hypothetical protein
VSFVLHFGEAFFVLGSCHCVDFLGLDSGIGVLEEPGGVVVLVLDGFYSTELFDVHILV